MEYSHSYIDPETGNLVDVMVDGNDADYRNAGPRDHRGGNRPPSSTSMPNRPGPRPHRPGGSRPTRPRPTRPRPTRPYPDHANSITDSGEYVTIPKSLIAELIPATGQVWASFLGLPDAPQATGNDVIDRDNATMHRDALAMHQQNQTRILSLSNLASRLVKLFV